MASGRYWVEIFHRDTLLGAGFFVMPHLVFTAYHCVAAIPDDDTVDLHCATGDVITGKLYRHAADADLALIEIIKPHISAIELLQARPPRQNEAWSNPYRPTESDPYLRGVVTHPSIGYVCAAGASMEVMQLICEQGIGDFSGYSGSPIERNDGDDPALLGILLEQYPDRESPQRATDVLFAVTMDDALRRFDCFAISHLLGVLYPQADSLDEKASAERSTGGTVRAILDDASALVDQLKQWVDDGVLDPTFVNEATLRIARSVVESGISEMTR